MLVEEIIEGIDGKSTNLLARQVAKMPLFQRKEINTFFFKELCAVVAAHTPEKKRTILVGIYEDLKKARETRDEGVALNVVRLGSAPTTLCQIHDVNESQIPAPAMAMRCGVYYTLSYMFPEKMATENPPELVYAETIFSLIRFPVYSLDKGQVNSKTIKQIKDGVYGRIRQALTNAMV